MYSLLDLLAPAALAPRVYVVSDSDYRAALDRRRAEKVAALEARRGRLEKLLDDVKAELAELEAAPS